MAKGDRSRGAAHTTRRRRVPVARRRRSWGALKALSDPVAVYTRFRGPAKPLRVCPPVSAEADQPPADFAVVVVGAVSPPVSIVTMQGQPSGKP